VDDASQDRSWEHIKKFQGRLTAIRLKENSGGNARGKNIGIALSDTKYVACFDSDDMMTPHSLEYRLNALIEKDTEWSFGFYSKTPDLHGYDKLQCELSLIEIMGLTFEEKTRARSLFYKAGQKLTNGLQLVGGTTVLAKRVLYERFGLFDEELKWKIDKEMWMRWLSREIAPAVVPRYIAIYRRHSQSTNWSAINERSSKKNIKEVNIMYEQKIKMRSESIVPENTLVLDKYDPFSFIEEIVS
jgi:glycosyltransferase involved in cell wall biosynthesis